MSKEAESTRSIINNLENVAFAYLGLDVLCPINNETVADLLRKFPTSPIVHMAIISALVNDDADYKLVLRENTRKHAGGVPKLALFAAKLTRADQIRQYVDNAEADGGGTEAAVAAACLKFSISRSTVFECLKMSKSMKSA